jgi:DNA-binding beta-propeller fold protein YncE
MVQVLLNKAATQARRTRRTCAIALVLVLALPCWARHKEQVPLPPPDILLEGGRKLAFETSFHSEREARGKPGFWTKVVNIVAGEPDYKEMVRPYSIAVDSQGREIITDPGMGGIHIFDFAKQKYKFLSRPEAGKDPMLSPQCVAVDSEDNIYVTDSVTGKIFVFDRNGKLRHVLGSLHGGEGYFKRPTGIAVDSVAKRIYITDTLRNKVFVLDMDGNVLNTFGSRDVENLRFNFPTEILARESNVYVVDAMNFRVQILTASGEFGRSIGAISDSAGGFFRPKGIAIDSEGHLYVVDAYLNAVQVFDAEGNLLYYFGGSGTQLGQFQLPAGVFIDHKDRIYVVDSYNHRVQVFRYTGLAKQAIGGQQ